MIKEQYLENREQIKDELNFGNIHEVPEIEKIVINTGCGEVTENMKILDAAKKTLSDITGQKPIVTRAKKSLSNFKVKQGQPVGLKVTLRGAKMWSFLERLIHIALPRVRDFNGIASNKFDGNGNLNFGIKEQIIFPEINYEKVNHILGFDVAIIMTTDNDKESYEVLKKLGFPFKK